MKRSAPYLLPLLLLGAYLAVAIVHPQIFLNMMPPYAIYAPYIVLLPTAILGWRFNLSKFTFISLLFAGFYAIAGNHSVLSVPPASLPPLLGAAALLVPIGMLAFFFLRERGILNPHGLVRLGLLLLLLGLLLAAAHLAGDNWRAWLPAGLGTPLRLGGSQIPQAATIVAGLTILLLLTVPHAKERLTGPILAMIVMTATMAIAFYSPELSLWPDSWSAAERLLLGQAAFAVGLALAGLLLLYAVLELAYGNAFVDQLTQLPSRRSLDHRLASLGATFAIAMVDIDHFKRVNDRFGHDTGDQALRFLAAKLRNFRSGTAYRYGGEEFAIVMSRQKKDQVMPNLEQLRREIESASFFVRGQERKSKEGRGKSNPSPDRRLPLTVSIGAAFVSNRSLSPAETIVAADKALYRAKKKGRNRVEAARG